MPVHNGEKTIKESIKSVLSQTYQHWELIIINDCSIDQTQDCIKYFTDPRIIYLEQKVNSGTPATPRNMGINTSKGKYIAFLDADDIWRPEKLEYQISKLSEGYNIVCSNYSTFKQDPKKVINNRKFPEIIKYQTMLKKNCVGNLTGIYNREKLGIIEQKTKGHEDYIMWLELAKKAGEIYCIQETLAYYRIHDKSISSNKFKAAIWQWRIYREELKFNIIKSIYLFSQYAILSLSSIARK